MPVCSFCYEPVHEVQICPDCHRKFCEIHILQTNHDCKGDFYMLEP
ncbi:MAG: AN1-type zinc finger domain-containing protein [Promethearchaeota archaeon]